MILYYAVGGGLGHLTRARAVVHTLGLTGRIVLLTASPFAHDQRVIDNFEVVWVPLELAGDMQGYRDWLQQVFAQLRPQSIYLDTFPAGILGEFCDFPLPPVPIHYVARLLRWEEYAGQLSGSPPPIETSYCVEELVSGQAAFLRQHATTILPLELRDPPAPEDAALKWVMRTLTGQRRPLWLMVHSGPAAEIAELRAYAADLIAAEGVHPRLLLVAPQRPDDLPEDIAFLNLYPADIIFPYADRIITACGFNLMRQTEPYREKHRYLPLVRRFDDQFLRASRRREQA